MIGQSAGKNYAYLLGVYMGDGSIFSTPTARKFGLTSIDLDFCEAVKAALESLDCGAGINGPYRDERFSKSRPYWVLYGFNRNVLKMIEDDTGKKTKIPDMTDATDDEKKAFIQGVLDSEGYVAHQPVPNQASKFYMGVKFTGEWFHDFIRVMESVGLKVGKIGRETIRSGKTAYRATIKLTSFVDAGMRFNIARKQNRVEMWAKQVGFPQRLHAEPL